MQNIIFTYKPTAPLTDAENEVLSGIDYSEVPEMKTIIEKDIDGNVISTTIPYQANVSIEDFDTLKAMLESKGIVTEIGKWDIATGDKIFLDIKLYRDTLKDIETFETAVFLDGQDYTGKEDTFVKEPLLDDKGDPISDIDGNPVMKQPSKRTFVRVKSTKKHTLKTARLKHVCTFDYQFKRQLV